MDFLFSLVPTIIVLGVLILIHEFGHFIACRCLGVRVEKFSIGFGPEIIHWQGRETRYAISLLPLGGFVKPAGESISEVPGGEPKPGDYLAAPVWARMIIVCAGVIMNYLLALVLFTLIFMIGRPVPGTTIGGFVEGYPAKTSGLQAWDRITTVNATPVTTWIELTRMLETAPAGPLALVVERTENGIATQVPVTIEPMVENVQDLFGASFQVRRLGITPHPEANEFERYGFLAALHHAWITEINLTIITHKAIFYLILGKLSPKTLAGPIGIVSMAGDAVKLGLPYVLQLTATLSVSLAVINLLPIPALDGGHFFFLLIEGIRRKRLSLEFQERASQVGFVLLMALMVFVIYNDLVNLDVYGKVVQFFSGKS